MPGLPIKSFDDWVVLSSPSEESRTLQILHTTVPFDIMADSRGLDGGVAQSRCSHVFSCWCNLKDLVSFLVIVVVAGSP